MNRIAVAGAAGRMGRRLIALAGEDAGLQCVAALEAAGSAALGRDAGELAGVGAVGLSVTTLCDVDFDVLLDFSSPGGTMASLKLCRDRGRAILIGTTGHTAEQLAAIRSAAAAIAVLKAANTSVGVNVLLRIAKQLGQLLDDSYDVEIVETHHRFKADVPSGTAQALCDAVVAGRKERGAGESKVIVGRSETAGARTPGEIALHSIRAGDTVGEHQVHFAALGETITIAHSAHTRDTFALGALRAAKWLAGRAAGMYDMRDVLFGKNGG